MRAQQPTTGPLRAGAAAAVAVVAAPLAAIVLALAIVVVAGGPAWAHGATPDASNFASRVTGNVALADGRPAGAAAPPDGVEWRVLGADALLQVRNSSGDDVVVTGYNGEPFLRVGPEGVFENRRSPAAYLNADRYAQVDVPAAADAGARPEWHQISEDPQWQWHDHRIHWMAQESPPQVDEAAGATQTILDWTVPYEIAGNSLGVEGVLEWIPPPPVWPWLLGASVAVLLPVVLAAGVAGRHAATRATVAVLAAVAAGGVVVAAGDVLAVPAGALASLWAFVQTLLPAGIAVALGATLWRRPPADGGSGPGTTLFVAAVILAIGSGFVRLAELRSSQVVNVLPDWSVRAIVAASLAVVLSPLVVMVVRDRTLPDAVPQPT